MDLTEHDEDDENMDKKEPAQESASPTEEPDQEPHNAEATNEAMPDFGATPRPAPDMTEQPPDKISGKLKPSGTV